MSEIERLLDLVRTLPVGPIDRQTKLGKEVLDGLEKVWTQLEGTSDQSTYADKLWRAEELVWTPPLIKFCLERHGGTVNGSSRADLHFWEVDLEKRFAHIARRTHRQLVKADSRLDCAALARSIAAAVEAGNSHEGLLWEDANHTVTIKIGILIPESVQSTTTARRKRFRAAFIPLMHEQGWEPRPKGNVMRFSRPSSSR